MSRAAKIRAMLADMQVGDVIKLPARFSHADALYAVESHCRFEIMRELLNFAVSSKDGIATVERLPFDV